ncbi:MAG: hypothetical protein H6568_13310 [Lewinellaceae bacterium]|nr:hypothetical protein [Saprospiraceae bacterium]MCB9313732.1 hypothetical protein [Lewinellaceae bacterium]HRW75073.1 hypothetical protein [Saprospiraceae bacterium]
MKLIVMFAHVLLLLSCSSLRVKSIPSDRLQHNLLCDLFHRGTDGHPFPGNMVIVGVRSNVFPTGFLESYLNKRVENITEETHYSDLEFEQIALKDQSLGCGTTKFSMISWDTSMTNHVMVISDLFIHNNEYFVIFLEYGSQGHEFLYKVTNDGEPVFVKESIIWID